MQIELLPLNELIRRVRLDLGESQPTFAKRFGITTQTLCRWELRNRQAKYPVLEWCIRYALKKGKS